MELNKDPFSVHTPLIRGTPGIYGTHHRSTGGAAVVISSSSTTAPNCHFQQQSLRSPLARPQCKMYVDPTAYADPAEVLAEFTNEIRAEDVEVGHDFTSPINFIIFH